jgi:aryl-alcohol dehydrogenase (NADP+)
VTSAIIGPRTVEQLEDNLTAGTLELDAEALTTLDRASRGPLTYLGFMARGR